MAVGYRIYKPLGLTVVVWDGVVTAEDAGRQMLQIRADSDWPPGHLHLLDMTTATSFPTAADTNLIEMTEEVAETRGIRFAVVASRAFAEATRFQEAVARVGVSHMIVFNDVVGACSWLGVQPSFGQRAVAELRSELREQQAADTVG